LVAQAQTAGVPIVVHIAAAIASVREANKNIVLHLLVKMFAETSCAGNPQGFSLC